MNYHAIIDSCAVAEAAFDYVINFFFVENYFF